MTFTPSRQVESNQTSPHKDLLQVLAKHKTKTYQKPIADHTKAAFEELLKKLEPNQRPLLLDAGCGTGDSTRKLATKYPDHQIIGIDRSHTRLSKERATTPDNALFMRGDLVDFYRLGAAHGLTIEKQYLFYPNPYPKAAQLKNRWHGHPIFPEIIAFSKNIELRTNWEIYAQEFSIALDFFTIKNELISQTDTADPVSPFEEKYLKSGQTAYIVKTA